jgi:hypothetical protein
MKDAGRAHEGFELVRVLKGYFTEAWSHASTMRLWSTENMEKKGGASVGWGERNGCRAASWEGGRTGRAIRMKENREKGGKESRHSWGSGSVCLAVSWGVEGCVIQGWSWKRSKNTKTAKTYNTRDSLVVTDPTTDLALSSLSRGERTGSRAFY